MKIAFVVSNLGIGGVGTSLLNLLKALSVKNEYEIDVICLHKYRLENINGIKQYAHVVLLNGIDNIYSFFLNELRSSLKLFNIVRSIQLIFHAVMMKIHTGRKRDFHHCKLLAMYETSYDIVVSYHSTYGLSVLYPLYNITAKRKVMWVHSEIDDFTIPAVEYPKFDRIVCVSNAIKRSIERALPTLSMRTRVIYNIVNEEHIKEKALESTSYQKKNNEFLICSVGRLDIIKQYDLAIKAMSIILKRFKNVRWIVCGEGADRNRLEEIISSYGLEDKFLLLGNCKNPYTYINMAHIFCLTSRSEGFGLVLQEAKILGKPVVCTDFQAAREIITDHEDGLIVEQNPDAIADAVLLLLNNNDMRINYSCWKKTIPADLSRNQIYRLIEELRE